MRERFVVAARIIAGLVSPFYGQTTVAISSLVFIETVSEYPFAQRCLTAKNLVDQFAA